MEIGQLREEIDAIDKEMLSLFERRMKVSTGIAEYKRNNNLPVYDGKREREKLKRETTEKVNAYMRGEKSSDSENVPNGKRCGKYKKKNKKK